MACTYVLEYGGVTVVFADSVQITTFLLVISSRIHTQQSK